MDTDSVVADQSSRHTTNCTHTSCAHVCFPPWLTREAHAHDGKNLGR
jgi:hypothetical protein